MSDTDLERLRVFCDVCVPTYKASTMEQAEITYRWPAGDQNVVRGYVCPACGMQYTKLFGYRDEELDSPRKSLLVPCGCDGERPAMYIDHVREDGGVGFRCWRCGATKEAESPRALAS
jgi:DNA-directed RNA polymerase subunit RPC12/RpoP